LLGFADPALRLVDQVKRAACVALGGFGVCVLGVNAAAQAPPGAAVPLLAAFSAAAAGIGALSSVLVLEPIFNQRRFFLAREGRHHVFEQELGSEKRAAFEASRGRDPRGARGGVERLVMLEEGERMLLVGLAVARIRSDRAIGDVKAGLASLFTILAAAGGIPIGIALAATPAAPALRAAAVLFVSGATVGLVLLAVCERQARKFMRLLAARPPGGSPSGLRLLAEVAIEQAALLNRHEDFFRAPPRSADPHFPNGRPFDVDGDKDPEPFAPESPARAEDDRAPSSGPTRH
jgi:hypothetical protein